MTASPSIVRLLFGTLVGALVLVGCDSSSLDSDSRTDSGFNLDNCTIRTDRLADGGVPRDGIPALNDYTADDDRLVGPHDEQADYLAGDDRVIGLLFGDQALAIPHNILWHHEIINVDDVAGRTSSVTLCPLTGT
ncbi:MAG: hypothetical protein BRD39_05035, partial [Bacteroidetes bacterium QH_9_64_21]